MAWTNPIDFTAQQSTLELWNTYLRDNMAALKNPETNGYAEVYAATTTTTTSTTFANISSDFSKTITTTGGDILVLFTCFADSVFFDISFDGSRLGGVDGILKSDSANGNSFQMAWLIQEPSIGEHTIAIQWKSTGGTATINNAYPPYFHIREVS